MPKILLIALLIISLAISGCTAQAEQETADPSTPKDPQQPQETTDAPADPEQPTDKLHFLEGELELSAEIGEWIAALRKLEGAYTRIDGEYIHVLIAMGERNTGGYTVELNNIGQFTESWIVLVQFTEPAPGSMVTEAFTYPYLLVSLKTDMDVRVQLTDDPGDPINMHIYRHDDVPLSENIILDNPIPYSAVDGTIHIAGRADIPGTVTVELEDGHNYLIEPTMITADQEGDQLLFDQTLSYRTPSSPMGTLVITVGNELLVIPVRFIDWDYSAK